MRRPSGTIITGVLIFIILAIGLVISLFVLISPTQAGQAVLRTSVDVAATAQAIQFQNRQAELEAISQAQQATWEASISDRQQALTEFKQNAGAQVAELQAQLESAQARIDQVTATLQTTQDKITELQHAIEADQLNYQAELATLDQEMTRLESELQNKLTERSAALQAAYDKLDTDSPAADTTKNERIGNDDGPDEEEQDRDKSVNDDNDGDSRSDDKQDDDDRSDDNKSDDEATDKDDN